MKHIIFSLALVAVIPFITLALEPTDPRGFCERFINEKDIHTCQERTKKEEVDWYAATICNLQKDDQAFWNCWDGIKGQVFNPALLDRCSDQMDLNDLARQSCVNAAIISRTPAGVEAKKKAEGLFQPLKVSK